jgi:hypothetical protein
VRGDTDLLVRGNTRTLLGQRRDAPTAGGGRRPGGAGEGQSEEEEEEEEEEDELLVEDEALSFFAGLDPELDPEPEPESELDDAPLSDDVLLSDVDVVLVSDAAAAVVGLLAPERLSFL